MEEGLIERQFRETTFVVYYDNYVNRALTSMCMVVLAFYFFKLYNYCNLDFIIGDYKRYGR